VVTVTVLGGVTGVAAMTGGPSPAALVQAVQTCREQVTASQPGPDVSGPDMGRCVIAIASQRDATPGRAPGVPSVQSTTGNSTAQPAGHGAKAADPSPSPPGQDGNAQGENAQGENGNAQGDGAKPPDKKPDKQPKDKHPQPTPS